MSSLPARDQAGGSLSRPSPSDAAGREAEQDEGSRSGRVAAGPPDLPPTQVLHSDRWRADDAPAGIDASPTGVEDARSPSRRLDPLSELALQMPQGAADRVPEMRWRPVEAAPRTVPDGVLQAREILGVVGEDLTPELIHEIGRAIGSEAVDRHIEHLVLGRDGRLSSGLMTEALVTGLVSAGVAVTDIGLVPAPVLHFAAHQLQLDSSIMITADAAPPSVNGIRLRLGGQTADRNLLRRIVKRIERNDLRSGEGKRVALDCVPEYIERIRAQMSLTRPLKLVVDCGNATAGVVAPALLRGLGCEVIELSCTVNGSFPSHLPDPSRPENLQRLVLAVREHGTHVGIAFDGDGDRLGVVDSAGNIVRPDRVMMLFAADMLARNPGATVVTTVTCSMALTRLIAGCGGKSVLWKRDPPELHAKMVELGALAAGDTEGHFCLAERWLGFSDALYAAANLVRILARIPSSSSGVLAGFPGCLSSAELVIPVAPGQRARLQQRLIDATGGATRVQPFVAARLTMVDGLRVDYEDRAGWVVSAETASALVVRFEATTAAALQRIQTQFSQLLSAVDPNLRLPL